MPRPLGAKKKCPEFMMIWLFRTLDLDSAAQYLVNSLLMNLFTSLLKAVKAMNIFKKLKQLIESLIQSLLFIILWTSPQMKSGNATSRIAQFIGRNHFIVKEIKDVFNIPISVHISTYLSNQNETVLILKGYPFRICPKKN
jgi:hypothetical protein